MDTLTPQERHENMARIKSRDTKPEKQIRSALHRAGFRYRICDKRYPGKPDLIFPRYYAVIFINGCFWHAHGWDSSRSSIISSHANGADATYAHGWIYDSKSIQRQIISSHANGADATYAHGWDSSRSSIISSHANGAEATYAHGADATYAHGCPYFRFPKSNQKFWSEKFMHNRERDQKVMQFYREECWRICVVWECSIRGKNSKRKIEKVTGQIIEWLEEPDEDFLEISG